MSSLRRTLAAAALSLATFAPPGFASAADLPVKAVKAPAELPFFLVIDDRVTFSYIFTAAQPGLFSVNPNGSIDGKTPKQVYSFTHFDLWAYGTNFFTISMFKSGHTPQRLPDRAGELRGRQRNLRPVPLDLWLEPDLQHQGVHRRAAQQYFV